MNLIRSHHISFKNALAGLQWAFSTQPNFRVHFTLTIAVLIAGIVFKITNIEMIILILTIVIGLACEMINTSIEAMTDLITSQWHKQAKIAKDVAAGMMLLAAFGATLVAIIIFLPRIFDIIIGLR